MGQQGGDLRQEPESGQQQERTGNQQNTAGRPGVSGGNGQAAATQGNGHAQAPVASGNGHAPASQDNGQAPASSGTGQAAAGGGDGQAPAAGPGGRWPARHRKQVIVITTAIVAVLVGGGVFALTRGGQPAPSPQGGGPAATQTGPMRVLSVTPATGSRQVDGSQPIRVNLTAPVAAGSPMPTLTPAVAGSWQPAGDSIVFTPATPLSPSTQYRVTVPAGLRSAAGHQLGGPTTAQFTTGSYSTLRLAQLLAQLGYLPVTWQQLYLGMRVASAEQSSATLAGQRALAYDPLPGTFNWQQGYPASLASMWQPDSYNVVLRGAVMAFQSQHNMNIDGHVTPALWNGLFQAAMTGASNPSGYTYAVASKGSPETLTIWHNGQQVFHNLTNTGIPAAPTVDGTFPVYERFLHTIMSGTNPGGSHYSDPVSFVSYFNGGDAVHFFPRGSYGSPQSLGCVELPLTAAQQAYPYLTYGSLVTVSG